MSQVIKLRLLDVATLLSLILMTMFGAATMFLQQITFTFSDQHGDPTVFRGIDWFKQHFYLNPVTYVVVSALMVYVFFIFIHERLDAHTNKIA